MKSRNLKAVILAGGKGTRLYPITYEIPKPLLPIKRKPIINHLADLFLKHGIRDIFVLVSRDFEEEFKWWKKRYYPQKKVSIVAEPRPLGTFGGLHYLKKELEGGEFFLTNGDELKKINLSRMVDFYRQRPESAAIALVKVDKPQDYGVVITKNGRVEQFLEKPKNPPTSYVNSGLYLLDDDVFNYHPGAKFSMVETDLFPQLAREGKLAGFKFSGRWTDTGTWERYEKAVRSWK